MLNLDLTIAITQNFCNEGNFDKVWFRTRKGRKKLAVRFFNKLQQPYPELYQQALTMNRQDNFVMWDKRKKYAAYFAKNRKKNFGGAASEETKSANAAMNDEEAGANTDGGEESSNDTISSSSSSSSLTSSSSSSGSSANDSSSSSSSNTGDSVNGERKARRTKAS